MEEIPQTGTCSICGGTYTSGGHNAWPINDGTCCATCDERYVIPARIEQARPDTAPEATKTRGFAELDQLLQGHICSGHPFPLAGLSPHEKRYIFGEAMAWFRVAQPKNDADPERVLGPALKRCALLLKALDPDLFESPLPDDDGPPLYDA
jgi:hypothetical protein